MRLILCEMGKAMTHKVKIAVGAAALLAMASAAALADSRGRNANGTRDSESYDYNVPLALPPSRRPFGAMAGGATTTNSGITESTGKSPVSLAQGRSRRGRCAERTTLYRDG